MYSFPLWLIVSWENDASLILCLRLQIVDKALEEPKYSQLYAQLCQRLAQDAPNFEEPSNESQATQKQNTVRLCSKNLHIVLKTVNMVY